jgi:hypothetical protein
VALKFSITKAKCFLRYVSTFSNITEVQTSLAQVVYGEVAGPRHLNLLQLSPSISRSEYGHELSENSLRLAGLTYCAEIL